MNQLRSHLTYANLVATLALVIAIGGGSFAVAKTAKIGTKQLKNNAVTEQKIRDGAVTSSQMRDGVVTTKKIANAAVTGDNLGGFQIVQAPDSVACPQGTRVIGGGATPTGATVVSSVPQNNGWASGPNGIAYAICLTN